MASALRTRVAVELALEAAKPLNGTLATPIAASAIEEANHSRRI
jgi:hypothetical protein